MAQKNSKKKNNLNNLIKKNQDIFGLKKAWLQGKAALTSPANPLPERGLLFEALEPRVLMSADLSYGTATDLTLTFDSLATTYNLVDQAAIENLDVNFHAGEGLKEGRRAAMSVIN